MSRMQALADSPEYVLITYALILTPLALYVYHDILDARWRPVWRTIRYLLAYAVLYILAGAGLIAYIVVQLSIEDYKEVGASALALILGTYGAWKLLRLARIFYAHRVLVGHLQNIDKSLCDQTGLTPVGLEYHLFRHPRLTKVPTTLQRDNWRHESRHDFISSSLFDDDYPGDAAARIKWLSPRVRVHSEDADVCACRVALWMRLVLRRPRSEPWRLLKSTSPLVQSQPFRVSIGEALRALIMHGSSEVPPSIVSANPAEVLLNNGSLSEAAVGFFWIASEMGFEEIAQALAEMPPRWMRGVKQNGKQLIFELVMSMLLCERQSDENEGLQWLLSMPVLEWSRDVSNVNVWSEMAAICADAVVSLLPDHVAVGDLPTRDEAFEVVRDAVFYLKDATSEQHGFQGDLIGLSLIELIRSAYRAGYVVEQVLGKALHAELLRENYNGDVRLYKGEIVSGLYSILNQLGLGNSDTYTEYLGALKQSWGVDTNTQNVFLALKERTKREMEDSFNMNHLASSRYWFCGDQQGRCKDPNVAFASVATTARELVPMVLIMAKAYEESKPQVELGQPGRNAGLVRDKWFWWKRSQALEVSGSTEQLAEELGAWRAGAVPSALKPAESN